MPGSVTPATSSVDDGVARGVAEGQGFLPPQRQLGNPGCQCRDWVYSGMHH